MQPKAPGNGAKTSLVWLFVICLSSLSWAASAALNASLDSNVINEGETVQLILQADSTVSGDPQLNVLRQNFEILGTSQSSSIRIVNGRRSDSVSWYITLGPKHGGKLTIPAIQVGQQRSQPLELLVRAASSSLPPASGPSSGSSPGGSTGTSANNASVFIEVSVDTPNPRDQQQVLYTVRLFHDRAITGGSLDDPKSDELLIHRLGKDREYRTQRNGHSYDVFERRYALFPQRSGKIEIPALVFDGKIAVPVPRQQRQRHPQDPFDRVFGDVFGNDHFMDPFTNMVQRSKRVRLRSKPISLNVQPAASDPQAPNQAWLPAKSLRLSESGKLPEQITVGEPLNRTLRIEATGLSAAQLPELATTPPGQSNANFKAYPDQAVLKDISKGGDLVGTREQQWALIAQRPGHYSLPAIRLPWWNTENERFEIARLPAHEIEVVAPAGYQPPPPASTPPKSPVTDIGSQASQAPAIGASNAKPLDSQQTGTQASASPAPVSTPASSTLNSWLHPWLLSVLFATLWLITLMLWLRARNQRRSATSVLPPSARTNQDKAAKAAIKRLAKAREPAHMQKALVEWANARFPDGAFTGLGAVEQAIQSRGLLTDELRTTLHTIDKQLYSATNEDKHAINPDALTSEIHRVDKALQDSKQGAEEKLSDLYTGSETT